MLESLPVVFLVATALGFLAGIGVGGGSLLVLWLTLVLNTSQDYARLLNLMFFLPSAIVATICHRNQNRIDLKKLLPAMIGGCIASAVVTVSSKQINTELLEKCFGVLLILTGIREVFYKKKPAQRRNAR